LSDNNNSLKGFLDLAAKNSKQIHDTLFLLVSADLLDHSDENIIIFFKKLQQLLSSEEAHPNVFLLFLSVIKPHLELSDFKNFTLEHLIDNNTEIPVEELCKIA
jgi:hypothetical protein